MTKIVLVLFAVLASAWSCGGGGGSSPTVTVKPNHVALAPRASQLFTATVSGIASTAVTWTATGGTITAAGLYMAGATPGTFAVTATSVANPARSGSATITIVPAPVVVTISPPSQTVAGCARVQFSATVTGGSGSTAVVWSVPDARDDGGATWGEVDANGLWTAPDPRPAAQVVSHVLATSVADPLAAAVATMTTNFEVSRVTVSPATASVQVGGPQQFTAAVETSCGL